MPRAKVEGGQGREETAAADMIRGLLLFCGKYSKAVPIGKLRGVFWPQYSLLPSPIRMDKQCSAVTAWFVGVDVSSFE